MIQNKDQKKYSGVEDLYNIENNLRNYNNFLVSSFAKNLKGLKFIYDFGAGIGTLSNLYRLKTGFTPVCIELDSALHIQLKARDLPLVSDIQSIKGRVDGLFTSNVLEHIEDDQNILDQMYTKMSRGSKLIIYVPAFMILFSDLDYSVGHFRRYEKQELISKVTKAGFTIDTVYYVDSVGFFASLFLVLKMKILKKNTSLMPVSPRAMKFYDYFLFPFSRFLDFIGFRFFLGKNLYLEDTKNQST